MCSPKFGLHLLPLSVFILLPLTFITAYIIAVSLGHVEAGFPYISDTGTQPPESCVFGQLLNICAVLIGLTIYVRYEEVKEYNQEISQILCLNKLTLVLGILAATGMSIVGNFQESNVIVVHFIGALMAFGLGALYCCIDTYMSYHMAPHLNTKLVFKIRLAICFVFTTAFVLMFVGAGISFREKNPKADPTKWKPEDGGYAWHIVSTASEWLMAIAVLVYFASFIEEFKRLSMRAPKIEAFIPAHHRMSQGGAYGAIEGTAP